MELPRRSRGDELLRPGQLASLRLRLRQIAARHDLVTVITCAFDHRTRMLPFIYADTRMAPAGVRSIGSARVDAGFPKIRIVLQQWNKKFKPSQMKLDGRIPDIFMVSSMLIGYASFYNPVWLAWNLRVWPSFLAWFEFVGWASTSTLQDAKKDGHTRIFCARKPRSPQKPPVCRSWGCWA